MVSTIAPTNDRLREAIMLTLKKGEHTSVEINQKTNGANISQVNAELKRMTDDGIIMRTTAVATRQKPHSYKIAVRYPGRESVNDAVVLHLSKGSSCAAAIARNLSFPRLMVIRALKSLVADGTIVVSNRVSDGGIVWRVDYALAKSTRDIHSVSAHDTVDAMKTGRWNNFTSWFGG